MSSVQPHSASTASELSNVSTLIEAEDTVQKLECKLTSKNCTAQPIIVQVEHIIRNKPKSSTEKPQFGVTFNSMRRKCKSPRTNELTHEQERKTIAAIIDLSSKDEEIAGVATDGKSPSTDLEETQLTLETTPSDPRLLSGADQHQTTGYDPQMPSSSADSSIDEVAQTLAKMPWRPHLAEDSSTEYEITCCGWKKVKKPQQRPGNGAGPWVFRPNAITNVKCQEAFEDQGSVDSNWPPEMPENRVIQTDCYCIDHNDDWIKDCLISPVKNSNSDDCYCHGPKMNIPLPVYEPELDAMKEDYAIGNYAEPVVIRDEEVPKKVKFPLKEQEPISFQDDVILPYQANSKDAQEELLFPEIIDQDVHIHQKKPVLSPYYDRCEQLSDTQQHCEPLHQEPYQEPYQEPQTLIHENNKRCSNTTQFQRHCEPLITQDQGDSSFQHYEHYEQPTPFMSSKSFPEGDSLNNNQEVPIENNRAYHQFYPENDWESPTPTEMIRPPTPPLKKSEESQLMKDIPELHLARRPGLDAFNGYADDALISKKGEKYIKKAHPPSPPTTKTESCNETTSFNVYSDEAFNSKRTEKSNSNANSRSPSASIKEFDNETVLLSPRSELTSTPISTPTIPRLKVVLSPDERWKKVSKGISPYEPETNEEMSHKQRMRYLKSGQASPTVWPENDDSESLTASPSITLPPTPRRGSPEPGEVCHSETPLSEYMTPSPKHKASKDLNSPNLLNCRSPSKGSQEFFETQRYPTPQELQNAPSMSVPEVPIDIKKAPASSPDRPVYADKGARCPQDECKCAEIFRYLNEIKCSPVMSTCGLDERSFPQEVPRCYDVPCCPPEVPRCYDVPCCPPEVPRCYDVPCCPPEVPRCYDVPCCPPEVPRCYDVPCCPPEVPRCYDVPCCPPEVPRCYAVSSCPQKVPSCYEVPSCPHDDYGISTSSYVPQCPESSSCPKVELSERDNDFMSSGTPSCHCLPSVVNVGDCRQLNFLKKRKCEKPPSEPIPEMKKICSPSGFINKSQPSVHLDTVLNDEKIPVHCQEFKTTKNQSLYFCEPLNESWNPQQFSAQIQQAPQLQQNPQFKQNPFELLKQPLQDGQLFWQNSMLSTDFNFTNSSPDQSPTPTQLTDVMFTTPPDVQTEGNESWRESRRQMPAMYDWHYQKAVSPNNTLVSYRSDSLMPQDWMPSQFNLNQRPIGSLIHSCNYVHHQEQQCLNDLPSSPCRLVSHQPSTPPVALKKPFCHTVSNHMSLIRQTSSCNLVLSKSPQSSPSKKTIDSYPCCGEETIVQQSSPGEHKSKCDYHYVPMKQKPKPPSLLSLGEKQRPQSFKDAQKLLPAEAKSKERPKQQQQEQELYLEEEYAEHLNIAPDDVIKENRKTFVSPNLCRHHSVTSLLDESQPGMCITPQRRLRQQSTTSSSKDNSQITKFQSPRSRNVNWQWHPQAIVTCPPTPKTISVKNKSSIKSCGPRPRSAQKSVMQQHLEMYPEEPRRCKPNIYHQCTMVCNARQCVAPTRLQSPVIQECSMPYSEIPYPARPCNAIPICSPVHHMQIPTSPRMANIINSQLQQIPTQCVPNSAPDSTQSPSAIFDPQSYQTSNSKMPYAQMSNAAANLLASTEVPYALNNNRGSTALSRSPLSHGSNFTRCVLPSAAETQDQGSQFQRQIILQPKSQLASVPQATSDTQVPTSQQVDYASKATVCHNQETQTSNVVQDPMHYVLESRYQLPKQTLLVPDLKNRTIATETSEIDFSLGLNTVRNLCGESTSKSEVKYSGGTQHQPITPSSSPSCHYKKTPAKIEPRVPSEIKPCKPCRRNSRHTNVSCCPSDRRAVMSEPYPSDTETPCQHYGKRSDLLQQPTETYPALNSSNNYFTSSNEGGKMKTKKHRHRHCPYTAKSSLPTLPTSNIPPSNQCWYCRQPFSTVGVNPMPVPPQPFGNVNSMAARLPMPPEAFGNVNPIATVPMQSQPNYIRIAYIPVPYVPQNHQLVPRILPSKYLTHYPYQYQVFDEYQLHEDALSSSASSRSSQQGARRSLQHICKPEPIEQHRETCSCQGDHESDYSDADSGCVTPTPFDLNVSSASKERCHYIQPRYVENIHEEQGPSENEGQKDEYYGSVETIFEKFQKEDYMDEGRRTCSVLKLDPNKTEEDQTVEQNQNNEQKFHNCQCSVEGNLGQQAIWPHLKLKRQTFSPLSPPLAHPVATSQSLPTEFDQSLKGQRTIRIKKSPRKNKSPLMDVVNGRSVMETTYSHLHANSSVSEPLINGYQPPQEGHIPSAWSKRRCHYHRCVDTKNLNQCKIPEERSVSCNGCATPSSPKLKCACSVLAFNTEQASRGGRSPTEFEYHRLSPEFERPASRKRWTTANEVNIVKVADDVVQDENST